MGEAAHKPENCSQWQTRGSGNLRWKHIVVSSSLLLLSDSDQMCSQGDVTGACYYWTSMQQSWGFHSEPCRGKRKEKKKGKKKLSSSSLVRLAGKLHSVQQRAVRAVAPVLWHLHAECRAFSPTLLTIWAPPFPLFLQSKPEQGHCASLQGQSSQCLHADLLEALSSLTAAEREPASRCRL